MGREPHDGHRLAAPPSARDRAAGAPPSRRKTPGDEGRHGPATAKAARNARPAWTGSTAASADFRRRGRNDAESENDRADRRRRRCALPSVRRNASVPVATPSRADRRRSARRPSRWETAGRCRARSEHQGFRRQHVEARREGGQHRQRGDARLSPAVAHALVMDDARHVRARCCWRRRRCRRAARSGRRPPRSDRAETNIEVDREIDGRADESEHREEHRAAALPTTSLAKDGERDQRPSARAREMDDQQNRGEDRGGSASVRIERRSPGVMRAAERQHQHQRDGRAR